VSAAGKKRVLSISKKNQGSALTAPGIAALWLGDAPVFVFGDGRIVIDGQTFQPHDGAIVSATLSPNSDVVMTAGDDGRIFATKASGGASPVFEQVGAWFDALIAHASSGLIAIICGREVLVFERDTGAEIRRFKPARAPNSISFCGEGDLLAIGHSGGVSLFRTQTPQEPWFEFPCNGGPVSVALNPTGGFLFAGLSEPALAGWRLSDGQGFRMGGYPGKPRQLVWNENGTALLTTGGPALLVWPMISPKGDTLQGPMGQAAGVYRPRLGLVTAVASHGEKAAVGWSDGGVDVVNLSNGTHRHIGGPKPRKTLDQDPRALTTAIISTSWRADGKQICWISETGQYGSALVQ
jgi:hypothetical protein